jgi:fructose/tagatose bisphosphate aldolase
VRPGQLGEAVGAGIRKLNISSELHAAFAHALDQHAGGSDPRPALRAARAAVADTASARIDQLGAAHRA